MTIGLSIVLRQVPGFICQQKRQCGQQAFDVRAHPLHMPDRLLLCTELIMQELTSIVMLGLTLLGLRAAHSCNIAIAHKPAGSAKHAVSQRMMRTMLYFVCAVVQVSAAATWLYFSIVLPSWFNPQSSPSDNTLLRLDTVSAILLQRAFRWPQWLVNLLWLLTCVNQLSAQACSYICQAVTASIWVYFTAHLGTRCRLTYTNPLSRAAQAAISLEIPSMLILAVLQYAWKWPTWLTYALWLVSDLSKPRTADAHAQPPPSLSKTSNCKMGQQSMSTSTTPFQIPAAWHGLPLQPDFMKSRQRRKGCTVEKATQHSTASFSSEATVIACIKAAITCLKATVTCTSAAVTAFPATAPKLLQVVPEWLLFPQTLDDAVMSFCQSPARWFSWGAPVGRLLVQVITARWIGDETEPLSSPNSAAAMQQGGNAVPHAASAANLQHQQIARDEQLRAASHARPAATVVKQRPGRVSIGSHVQSGVGSQPNQLHLPSEQSPVSEQYCTQAVQLRNQDAVSDVFWEVGPDLGSNDEALRNVYNIDASCQVVPDSTASSAYSHGHTIHTSSAAPSLTERYARASRQDSRGGPLAGNSQQSASRLNTAHKLRKLVSLGMWRSDSIRKPLRADLVQNRCSTDTGEAQDASSQHMRQPKLSAVQKLRRRLSSGRWRVRDEDCITRQSAVEASHGLTHAMHVADATDNGCYKHEQTVQQSAVSVTKAVEIGRRTRHAVTHIGSATESGLLIKPGSTVINTGHKSKPQDVQKHTTGRLTVAQKLRRKLSSGRWTGQ